MDNNEVKQLLNNIKNPKQREVIEKMLFGKIKKKVICNKCENIMAYIYSDDTVEAATDDQNIMWMLAHRPRLDGFLGFQCRCGNDSRLCKAEKGNKGIETNQLQPSDIVQVFNKLRRKPADYPIDNHEQIIDNFTIIEL